MMKKINSRTGMIVSAITVLLILGINGTVIAADQQGTGVYPLDYCIVSGEKLGVMGDLIVYNYEGREIRFCCKDCVKSFEAKPETYLKKLDAAIIEQQLPYYPLTTCVVTKEKLDSMGEPINYVYKNRLIRFCCQGCIGTFLKNPDKYLAELDEAVIEQQLKTYPLDTCIVSGSNLGGMGEPINFIYGNRLIRFCCGGCIDTFLKNPSKYLPKLEKTGTEKSKYDQESHEKHDH
ncbi:MAG: hypothetical protein A2161_16015 [Candidatus Schekmanbacteria bacterium RBG_13_48_7]|uniref:TRASH domain-containing protein n=1 Tax=Candidatus Schekmanbacteria bacterium RBG_13_48_7 TaxID=1817878 RepID=A0A1F7RSQ4_9BACT|nr:MAG: hypothetical protein A2161_16015 [Candidatus Schekmanbacteria bacterium RBG_13_48_7]